MDLPILRGASRLAAAVVIGLAVVPLPAGNALAAGGGESESAEPTDAPDKDRLFELKPLLVQLRDAEARLQTVVLNVTLELEHPRRKQRVTRYLPRLRDLFLRRLSPPPLDHGYVDLAAAKAILLQASVDVLGPEVVRDVRVLPFHQTGAG